MEDDYSPSDADVIGMAALDCQSTISDIWIGMAYEVVRLLDERKLLLNEPEFSKLHHYLRYIRVPLEKHELAGRKKDFPEEVKMTRRPATSTASDHYVYEHESDARAHIMMKGQSARGSSMWHLTDNAAGSSYWIERRELAERMLRLWRKYLPTSP
jgi:hypothetical protein